MLSMGGFSVNLIVHDNTLLHPHEQTVTKAGDTHAVYNARLAPGERFTVSWEDSRAEPKPSEGHLWKQEGTGMPLHLGQAATSPDDQTFALVSGVIGESTATGVCESVYNALGEANEPALRELASLDAVLNSY